MNSYRNLLIERVCVAKILCALKIARFPAVRAVPSKLFLHPRAPRFSPGGTQRGIPIYKDGGTPDVFATLRWFGLGSPIVPVVQPSQSHMRKDVTCGYRASSSVWRSLPQSEMCAVLVVVANILSEQAFQVAFVNCDDVIQEITAATPYPTLCDSILPRTLERGADQDSRSGIELLRGLPVHTWHPDQR